LSRLLAWRLTIGGAMMRGWHVPVHTVRTRPSVKLIATPPCFAAIEGLLSRRLHRRWGDQWMAHAGSHGAHPPVGKTDRDAAVLRRY
jgi:hypothetical protein